MDTIMRLALTGRHVDVTPSLRQLVTRRLAKIERLLNDSVVSAQVVLTLEKQRHNTEVTVHARGDNLITGKGSAATWPEAVTQAVEKVMQQALKVKEKWVERKRRSPGGKGLINGRTPMPARAASAALAAAAPSAETGDGARPARRPTVVRTTRYAVEPMSLEDAALRFEDASEPFVVFRHAQTDRITILYERSDGRLGLIDPEG